MVGCKPPRRHLEYVKNNFQVQVVKETIRRSVLLDLVHTKKGWLRKWVSEAALATTTMR